MADLDRVWNRHVGSEQELSDGAGWGNLVFGRRVLGPGEEIPSVHAE